MLEKVSTSQVDSPERSRAPADLQDHLARLEAAGLLVRIDRPINKDTELHPLVRWQFQGGLAEERAPRVPVHQCHRRQRPPLRHAGRGRRAGGIAGDLCASAWAGRSTISARPGSQAIAHPIAPVRVTIAAVPGGGHHGRCAARARRGLGARCRCRSRRRASTRRPISPRRSASRAIPRPASRTWAPIARR